MKKLAAFQPACQGWLPHEHIRRFPDLFLFGDQARPRVGPIQKRREIQGGVWAGVDIARVLPGGQMLRGGRVGPLAAADQN